jgi:intracellular septation protein
MKLLFDFLPILLFFIAYKINGIYVATAVAVIVSCLQVGFCWYKYRRIEHLHLITLLLIIILGGATLFLHNDLFIKWKPTIINWLFAVAFIGSQFIGDKPIIQRMLDSNVSLAPSIWKRLNISWTLFFLAMGIANLYVIYHFDTDTWVNFKLFGMLGLTVIFVLLQAIYLARHIEEKPHE